MNKEQEQGLFNQIEEVLRTHEDAYEPGAWEDFDANRKKKNKRPIYGWIAAAVVLLTASIGLLELTKKEPKQGLIAMVEKKDTKKPVLSEDTLKSINSREILTATKPTLSIAYPKQSRAEQHANVTVIENPENTSAARFTQPAVAEKPNQPVVNVHQPAANTRSAIETGLAQNVPKHTPISAGAYDSLMNRNRVTPNVDKNASKLTYSLVVSPSLSNQKMNFGAGMELSYPLNKSISINSGLMYATFSAKSDGKSLASTNSNAQSPNANLALAGIELPLGIQYQTTGGFYAAAGVSAVGLINDKLEYNYLQENTVVKTQFSAATGTNINVLEVVSERKTENSIEPINNYMGFFNFSAGKKQAFGKTNLNIGPFIKVPFSSVSSEKIKLLQGGLKISVDF